MGRKKGQENMRKCDRKHDSSEHIGPIIWCHERYLYILSKWRKCAIIAGC